LNRAAEKPSIFIDAGVLITGAASTTGASHLLLQLGELGLIDVVTSKQVQTECERNLVAALPAALPAFRLLAKAACRLAVEPHPRDLVAFRGESAVKDLPVLAAAVKAGCQSLITFNVGHYGPRKHHIRIETPTAQLTRLRKHLTQLAEE
jgi:predicted nucleic acid-binding protein